MQTKQQETKKPISVYEYKITEAEYNSMDAFAKAEVLNRLGLQQVLSEEAQKTTYFTDEYCAYDAYKDVTENGLTIRYMLEMKVRNKVYPDYMIDEKKILGLRKEREKLKKEGYYDAVSVYVNYTPAGTFFWNIESCIRKTQKVTTNAARYTAKESERIDKPSYMFKVSDADKSYSYIINKDELLKRI